jgi:formylglycine-generating enzyme required for sulfatase activity
MNRVLLPLVFFGASFCALQVAPPAASAVTIDWVTVGDPGNATDPATGSKYGSVGYSYRISKYVITNAQYAEFLNSNDPSGANSLGLYNQRMANSKTVGGIGRNFTDPDGPKYFVINGFADRPVAYVNFFDALRFANWLHNGQAPGSTEFGAYTLLGGTPIPSNTTNVARNPEARTFLPSEDEWYKAAYYNPANGTYFRYPTSSDEAPIASPPTPLANHANLIGPAGTGGPGTTTPVTAYSGTMSPHGALDMAGNVQQWNESANIDGTQRYVRGGSYIANAFMANAASRLSRETSYDDNSIGFRVAAVIPEPSTGVMAGIGCCLLGLLRKRLQKA